MLRRVDIPTSQNTVHPFTTPDTSGQSSPNFAGLTPEGQAALALAWSELDGEPLVGEVGGDDDPEPPSPAVPYYRIDEWGQMRCSVGSWLQEEEPQDDPTEETAPEDLPSYNPPGDEQPWPERDPRIGDAEDLLGGVTALRALTCPSEISEGGTEVLIDHLAPLGGLPLPAPSPALTFYLAYDSSGTRIGQPSGAAGMTLSRALDELVEIYRDLGELGWGEEAERLDEARADLHLLRVTLSGALTPAALAALTGLDSSDAEAIPRADALLQRLQREALPSPTPAELARLMRAAVGAGRQEELAAALLAGDESRIHFLQLALLLPGAP